MRRKTLLKFVIFSVFALFAGVTFLIARLEMRKPALPVLGQVHEFELTDSLGRDFQSSQLRGKVWIADFIFTTCGSICPIMTSNMAKLQEQMSKLDSVTFVSISVNPEYDTPEVLRRYAKKYGAKEDQWYFLTGTREKIQEISVRSFKIGSVKDPIFHSPRFVLVDRDGFIRGYYDGTEDGDLERLYHDSQTLIRGKR